MIFISKERETLNSNNTSNTNYRLLNLKETENGSSNSKGELSSNLELEKLTGSPRNVDLLKINNNEEEANKQNSVDQNQNNNLLSFYPRDQQISINVMQLESGGEGDAFP